jgi:hypothetical protein
MTSQLWLKVGMHEVDALEKYVLMIVLEFQSRTDIENVY